MTEQNPPANPLFAGFQPQPIVNNEAQPAPITEKKPRKPRTPKLAKSVPVKPKKARKPRAAKPKAPTSAPALPQYNLQTILQAMRSLEEADYPAFDKLFSAPEASRKRIMAAMAKIFP